MINFFSFQPDPRFLAFEELPLVQAKSYAKKPRVGKAKRPLHNRNPPPTTASAKRPRLQPEEDLPQNSPPSTGNNQNLTLSLIYTSLLSLPPKKKTKQKLKSTLSDQVRVLGVGTHLGQKNSLEGWALEL